MTVVARCRSCQATIMWMKTDRGKKMPVDFTPAAQGHERWNPKTMVSHFDTCPNADDWRKNK
jgi:hypothetical protein